MFANEDQIYPRPWWDTSHKKARNKRLKKWLKKNKPEVWKEFKRCNKGYVS